MSENITIMPWNVKGIKSDRKSSRFWEEIKTARDIDCWAIQEHHLEAGSQRKQVLGRKLVFYSEGSEGFSGVMMVVDRDLEPQVVWNHPSGRAIAVKIAWHGGAFTIVNVYGQCEAKGRAKLWSDLKDMEIEGEWCLMGDFNMVEARKYKPGPSSILAGSEKVKWDNLCEKWALVDLWTLGPWNSSPGFTYTSLQYANTASRLDRCYCSHQADWIPTRVEVRVDSSRNLSDHLPLAVRFR